MKNMRPSQLPPNMLAWFVKKKIGLAHFQSRPVSAARPPGSVAAAAAEAKPSNGETRQSVVEVICSYFGAPSFDWSSHYRLEIGIVRLICNYGYLERKSISSAVLLLTIIDLSTT